MTRRLAALVLSASMLCWGCSGPGPGKGATDPDCLPNGLLLALSQFEVTPEGKTLPRPKAARLEILTRRSGAWKVTAIEDPDSNVFHKAMVYDDRAGGSGILTLSGSRAAIKLWRLGADGFTAETIWEQDFGGKFSRMREAELMSGPGGVPSLAVATHDQGVVAVVTRSDRGWEVSEIDRREETFVHEIEIGDLDGDGVQEVYATPSDPNVFDGKPQRGRVVRYVPSRAEGPETVADLGDRHAKEILVADMDGDGRDELYVSVEAVGGGRLEIRRYDASTDPAAGSVIARLEDRLCRFLTVGDVDGDGRPELVAAAHKSGLWLLRPPSEDGLEWALSSIDRESSGFEHAALLTDLDGDGVDELYVASDDQGEVRRYRWNGSAFDREVIHSRDVPDSVFTWNLMPVPLELLGGACN